jgi:hypothetical protein
MNSHEAHICPVNHSRLQCLPKLRTISQQTIQGLWHEHVLRIRHFESTVPRPQSTLPAMNKTGSHLCLFARTLSLIPVLCWRAMVRNIQGRCHEDMAHSNLHVRDGGRSEDVG